MPTRNTLVGVSFIDNQTGYAVGHAATILKTVSGENWTANVDAMARRRCCTFCRRAKRAVGGFSYIETKNGGNWLARLVEAYDDFHLNDLFADAKGNIYIPAEFGTVYKSRDRGQNWQAIETGCQRLVLGRLALSNGDMLVFGMRGNVGAHQPASEQVKSAPPIGLRRHAIVRRSGDSGRPVGHGAGLQQWRQKLYQSAAPRPPEFRHRHRQSWQ